MTSLLMLAFLSGYQQFSLDKLLMERFYVEEVASVFTPLNSEKWTDKEEFLQRIANRKPYNLGYCGYRWTKIYTWLCCCLRRPPPSWCCFRMEKFTWRERGIRRLERARRKLSEERDIENLIYNFRVLRMLAKTVLSHR